MKFHLVVVDPGLLLVPLDPREQLGDVVLAPLLSVLQPLGHLLMMTMIVMMLMTKTMPIAMTTRTIWISTGRDDYDDYKDAKDNNDDRMMTKTQPPSAQSSAGRAPQRASWSCCPGPWSSFHNYLNFR